MPGISVTRRRVAKRPKPVVDQYALHCAQLNERVFGPIGATRPTPPTTVPTTAVEQHAESPAESTAAPSTAASTADSSTVKLAERPVKLADAAPLPGAPAPGAATTNGVVGGDAAKEGTVVVSSVGQKTSTSGVSEQVLLKHQQERTGRGDIGGPGFGSDCVLGEDQLLRRLLEQTEENSATGATAAPEALPSFAQLFEKAPAPHAGGVLVYPCPEALCQNIIDKGNNSLL